jgi:hypothetical protein
VGGKHEQHDHADEEREPAAARERQIRRGPGDDRAGRREAAQRRVRARVGRQPEPQHDRQRPERAERVPVGQRVREPVAGQRVRLRRGVEPARVQPAGQPGGADGDRGGEHRPRQMAAVATRSRGEQAEPEQPRVDQVALEVLERDVRHRGPRRRQPGPGRERASAASASSVGPDSAHAGGRTASSTARTANAAQPAFSVASGK